jgi:hypothetical protein
VYDAPPVSPEFAARLGIPIEDLQEEIDRSGTPAKPHLAMIDSPGYFDTPEKWEQYLNELKALPADTVDRQHLIDRAEQVLARKRQEVENPSEVPITDTALHISADRDQKTVGFKPDYGLRLLKDGFSREADLYFYDFRLFSISVLGNGNYSTMVENRYDGEMHALSLDFNHAQLEEILVSADPKTAAVVRNELSQDSRSVREIEFDEYVPFAVRARLGSLQTGAHEQFVPLVAQEILRRRLAARRQRRRI